MKNVEKALEDIENFEPCGNSSDFNHLKGAVKHAFVMEAAEGDVWRGVKRLLDRNTPNSETHQLISKIARDDFSLSDDFRKLIAALASPPHSVKTADPDTLSI